jgi:hypothetical protein
MLDDYLLPFDDLDGDRLLSDWRWLIGDKPITIQAVAAVGNLFLRGESGRIYLLEIEDGTCECIAQSAGQFEEKVGDRHNRRAWLKGFLVRDLRRAGIVLGPGQCYGHKIPHHLGGVPGIENIEPVDLMVHVSVLGQLHRQTRALAPGTSIDEIRVVQPSSGPKDEVPSQ